MNDYSKKILKVPTVTFVREQDQGKQPVLDVRNLGIDFGGLTAVDSFNITIGPTEISGLIGQSAHRCVSAHPWKCAGQWH